MTWQSTDQISPLTDTSFDAKPEPRDDEFVGLWAFVWILFGFKAVMLLAILWFATRSSEDMSVLAATHWFFLLIPALAIAGPLMFQMRLRRVRRKRAELQASEWMVDELRNTP